MNDKAKELGAHNTNFENTNGLDSNSPEHKTTASDIGLVAKYAMNNGLFREIVAISEDKIILNDNEIPLINTNKLLSHGYIKGIKTGYTENAGFCIATYSDLNGLRLISIILNSSRDGREKDVLKLIYWADNNLKTVKLVNSDIPVDTIKLGSNTRVNVDLYALEDITKLIHATNNHIEISHIIQGGGDLPLNSGEKIGTISVSINGQNIGKTDLINKVSIDGPKTYQDISDTRRKKTIIFLATFLSFYFFIIIFIIFKNLLVKKYDINGGI